MSIQRGGSHIYIRYRDLLHPSGLVAGSRVQLSPLPTGIPWGPATDDVLKIFKILDPLPRFQIWLISIALKIRKPLHIPIL